MLIYAIYNKQVTSVHALDMRVLLKDEEVLSFGLDDFNIHISNIVVQAKSLYLYLIDYYTHKVLKKIQVGMHSINMKSVFYDTIPHCKEKQLKLSEEIKEFVEDQEKQGNNVLIPKINNKILAVQIGTSNLIRIYSLKLKTFIRQFLFTKQDVAFDDASIKAA